jgi:hypothetical protein
MLHTIYTCIKFVICSAWTIRVLENIVLMEIFKYKLDAEAESREVLNKKLHNLHTSTETVVVFTTKT